MSGFKLIQAIGNAGMKLDVTAYNTFKFQDSKLIAEEVLRIMIRESSTTTEDHKYRKMLEDVKSTKMGGE